MFNHRRRRGFSLIELLIVISIILIIIMMAAPAYQNAQKHARETAALVAIRTIHTAEVQYYSQFNRYAGLSELGPPANGGNSTAAGASLVDKSLSAGEQGGYKFVVTAIPGGYTVNATPLTPSSGGRSFYSDASMIVHYKQGLEPATASDPETK